MIIPLVHCFPPTHPDLAYKVIAKQWLHYAKQAQGDVWVKTAHADKKCVGEREKSVFTDN